MGILPVCGTALRQGLADGLAEFVHSPRGVPPRGPVERKGVARFSRDEVEVHMHHRLSGDRPVVLENIQPRPADSRTDRPYKRGEIRKHRRRVG